MQKKQMVIPIKITTKQLIQAYILCLNPLLKLKRREVELVCAMIRVYYNLKKAAKGGQIPIDDIDRRINDPMGRKIIRDLIKMTEKSHNNHICQLKKKKILTKEGYLIDNLKELDKQDLTVQYKFIINSVQGIERQEEKNKITG